MNLQQVPRYGKPNSTLNDSIYSILLSQKKSVLINLQSFLKCTTNLLKNYASLNDQELVLKSNHLQMTVDISEFIS